MARTRKPVFARTSACFAQLALLKRAPWASTTARSPAPYRSPQTTPSSGLGNETSLDAAVSPVNIRAAIANLRIRDRTSPARSSIEIRHTETAISRGALRLLRVDNLAVRSDLGRAVGNSGRVDHAGFKTKPAAGERLRGPDCGRIHPQIRVHHQSGGHCLLIQLPYLATVVGLRKLLYPPDSVVENDQAIRSGRIESHVMLVREPWVWIVRFNLKVSFQPKPPKHFAGPLAVLVIDLHHPILLWDRDQKIAATVNVAQGITVQPAVGRRGEEDRGTAIAARAQFALLVAQRLAGDIHVVKRVPYPRHLKLQVQVDYQVSQHIHWVLGSLGAIWKHTFQAGYHQHVAVRQADGLVMKSRNTLLAVLHALGADAPARQLLRHAAGIRFAQGVAQQIHLSDHLPALNVVLGIRRLGQH